MRPTTDEIDYLVGLEKIISAYEEIAAKRLDKIKKEVLENRTFLTELNQVFQIVKNNYQKAVSKHKVYLMSKKIDKTVRVFIAANTGLYGDLIQRVFALFRQDLKQKPGDVVIIGQLGKTLMEKGLASVKFAYFDYPDAEFDKAAAKKLVDHLVAYQTVIVYHGLFKNILMQDSISTNLTGEGLLPEVKEKSRRRLLFEPTLPEVLNFFETEFFSSLLVQTIYEAQLAKFSARMASLDKAAENIKEATKQAWWEYAREKHRLTNKKQQGLLATMSFWR